MMHAKAFTLAAVLAGSLGWTGSAGAAPLSPAPLASDGALIERAAGYCGPGFHPSGPTGHCRVNRYGPSYYRRFGPPPEDRYYRPRPEYRPYGDYRPRRWDY